MPVLSPQAQARQAELIRRYIDSLSGKQATIMDCWQQVQSSRWDTKSLAQLKVAVHRLAGSAGSHGLDSLGEAALALECSLRGGCGSADQRHLINQDFKALLRALQAAASTD